jgi:hypothetical protein
MPEHSRRGGPAPADVNPPRLIHAAPGPGDQSFYAAAYAKQEMLAVALYAISLGLGVNANLDAPNSGGTPYTQIHRFHLMG